MKANEAPEKIWIDPATDLPKLSGHIDKDSVEYIRTEVFIEKDSLTWQDINLIHHLLFDIKKDYDNGKLDKEEYYKEVLKQFKEQL